MSRIYLGIFHHTQIIRMRTFYQVIACHIEFFVGDVMQAFHTGSLQFLVNFILDRVFLILLLKSLVNVCRVVCNGVAVHKEYRSIALLAQFPYTVTYARRKLIVVQSDAIRHTVQNIDFSVYLAQGIIHDVLHLTAARESQVDERIVKPAFQQSSPNQSRTTRRSTVGY